MPSSPRNSITNRRRSSDLVRQVDANISRSLNSKSPFVQQSDTNNPHRNSRSSLVQQVDTSNPRRSSDTSNPRRSSKSSVVRQIDTSILEAGNSKSTHDQASPRSRSQKSLRSTSQKSLRSVGVRSRFSSIGGSSAASDSSTSMSASPKDGGNSAQAPNSPRREQSRHGSTGSGESSKADLHAMTSMQSMQSTNSIRSEVGSPGGRRGNPIYVCIRVRPTLKHEDGLEDAVTCASDGKTLLLEGDGKSKQVKQVTVDVVIDSRNDEGSQESVFNEVGRSLVTSVLKDYNVCIFAYGHTGSGKTHTMLGHGETEGPNAGLIPRFLRAIFQEHSKLPLPDVHYSCDFYEVYNETIRDLLAPTHVQGRDRKREVRVHPKYGVRIDGLSTSVVKNTEDILELVFFGNQMRTIAATTMNAQSSRSHAIFTFRYLIETENEHHESVMTFVDLAGREDQAASQNRDVQFREMTFINTSLFHLSHLIAKLSEGAVQKGTLSDFRNSKLTLLLSQALIGNSCTALIATIAPLKTYFDDSMSTLNFAQHVKKIKTKPFVNTKKYSEVVRELEKEVNSLRQELSVAKTSNTEHEQSLMAAMALLKHYRNGKELDQASSADALQTRRRVSVQLGLHSMHFGSNSSVPKSASGQPVPFLTKLSDDSALQGCCNFFLMKESVCLGGLRPGADILVQGVGIRAMMCIVNTLEDDTITIELVTDAPGSSSWGTSTFMSEEGDDESAISSSSSSDSNTNISECWSDSIADDDEPRVLVNGRHLHRHDGPRQLHHGDAIILGYAHAFRLVVPTLEFANLDAGTLARLKLANLDLSSAMREVEEEGTQKLQTLYPCLRQLSSSSSEGVFRSLMKALNKVYPMIDEANTLTREILGTSRFVFKLHIVTDLCSTSDTEPQIVVCAILNPQPSSSPNPSTSSPSRLKSATVFNIGVTNPLAENDCLIYTISIENFKERLNEMRELYQSGASARDGFSGIRKKLQSQPFANPWRESSFVAIKNLSETMQSKNSTTRSSAPDLIGSVRQKDHRGVTVQTPEEVAVHAALDRPHRNPDAVKVTGDAFTPRRVTTHSEERSPLKTDDSSHPPASRLDDILLQVDGAQRASKDVPDRIGVSVDALTTADSSSSEVNEARLVPKDVSVDALAATDCSTEASVAELLAKTSGSPGQRDELEKVKRGEPIRELHLPLVSERPVRQWQSAPPLKIWTLWSLLDDGTLRRRDFANEDVARSALQADGFGALGQQTVFANSPPVGSAISKKPRFIPVRD